MTLILLSFGGWAVAGLFVYLWSKRGSKLKSLKRDNVALYSTLRVETKLSVEQINALLADINPDDIDPNKYTGLLRKKSSGTSSS